MELIINNAQDQKQLGECIGKAITDTTIILLDGELGAGKTTLTQGIGRGLDIEETINSPTFTIAKQYEGSRELNHLDVYRLEGLDEDMGIEDYVYDGSVLIIEWSKFIDTDIFDEYLHIQIDYLDEARKIKFTPYGTYYEELLEKVSKCII
ncbi:MAG: tRNA (adenosine(37)-N6)-threonylcarbamoyltransferase complex ATPase subunit type 1 TsaE [Erysipelothrix sp.]|nr:tRNA (adenosine(37)-N6)-threonylcarbamoyltransferase complex ATPase subunit type 1 TsaE [Erysipelothrix sp.]